MVDIHSHLLPGIDDGAKDLNEAVTMAEMAAADGATDIFLTSHLNFEYKYDPDMAARLRTKLASRSPIIRLHSGCEVHLTWEHIQLVLQNPAAYTLGGKRYLLVELPDQFLWQSIRAALEILSDAGLRVVIAHPERNPQLRAEVNVAQEIVESGYLMQITARSLTGGFGPESAGAAEHFLQRQLVHFVASDAHSVTHRKPLLSPAHAHLSERFGIEAAELLTRTNGLAILNDFPVRPMRRPSGSSLRFFAPTMRRILGLSASRG